MPSFSAAALLILATALPGAADPALYARLLDEAKSQGFDVTKVVPTRQSGPGA
jgi:lipocalin